MGTKRNDDGDERRSGFVGAAGDVVVVTAVATDRHDEEEVRGCGVVPTTRATSLVDRVAARRGSILSEFRPPPF